MIEISALPPPADLDVSAALAEVTTAVAAFLEEDPSGTWAIVSPIAPGHDAEGADAPAARGWGARPSSGRRRLSWPHVPVPSA